MTNNLEVKKGQPLSNNNTQSEPKPIEKGSPVNPGDVVTDESQSIEEKAQQTAVNQPDITGDWIRVPTYFIVEYPNGEKKALHHVKDAHEINDIIRLARVDENGDRLWW